MCLDILPTFKNRVLRFFTVAFWDLLEYSEYKSFIRYVVCKYFRPVCGLPFHSLHSISRKAEVLKIISIFFYTFYRLGFIFRFMIHFEFIFVYGTKYG